ncbi:MAG TPA: L,D-transpeptidase family protein [Gemmatimonadaceae bacterium]|nr:L,D-transpeptidase family protein [Gemmatimonadaceae bacterium]
MIDRSKRKPLLIGGAALLLLLVAVAVALAARRNRTRWTEEYGAVEESWRPAPTPVRGIAPEVLRGAVEARLAAARPGGLSEEQWTRVRELYDAYERLPLWLEQQGPRERARALVGEIAKAPTHALQLADYPLAELRQALAAVRDSTATPSAERLAAADILLSAAYVTLAQDLLTGQIDPRTGSQDWHIDPRKVDVDSALAQRLRLEPLDRAIAQLRPQDEDYDALREQLMRYRELVAAGGWQPVPEGRALRPGDTDSVPRLRALVGRLRIEGYLDEGDTTLAAPPPKTDSAGVVDTLATAGLAVYDDRLAGAVAEFQARHGIDVDSILGKGTVASMGVSAAYRLGQIATNLERFRWLPRTFGERYILVNVPAFRLAAYDSGRVALEMKVIVGAEFEDRRTPVFSDSMQYVVFRPYWNVTDDIANKELWPKIARDPGYMARNRLETWRENGQTRLRQLPGPKNSLGLVKFLFPNDFNIYLHDTPEDELFERDVRAFSHGCIRLEQPAALAEWVLGRPADRVREAMEAGKDNRSVTLPRKLPVYIVYLTTFTRDGELHFGNDLYDRDSTLVEAVKDGALPPADTLRLLDELRGLVGS